TRTTLWSPSAMSAAHCARCAGRAPLVTWSTRRTASRCTSPRPPAASRCPPRPRSPASPTLRSSGSLPTRPTSPLRLSPPPRRPPRHAVFQSTLLLPAPCQEERAHAWTTAGSSGAVTRCASLLPPRAR
ncbi:hypothetical protein H4R21_000238, partial [Coemansia helicoidea]